MAETLTLDARNLETGDRRQVELPPKSLVAVGMIAAIDAQISRLLVERDARRRGPGGGQTAPLDERIRRLQRVVVWALTSPGPELPFPETDLDPDPPRWTADLSPRDVLDVVRVAQRVNAAALLMDTPGALSWSSPAPIPAPDARR